jgi:hypothetical protein
MVVQYQEGATDQQQGIEGAPGMPTRAPQPGPSSRVYGDTARHVESREGSPGGSVLATLDYRGTTQTVELVPGNPASRTDVGTAIREGLLRRNAAGHLEAVHNGPAPGASLVAAFGQQEAAQGHQQEAQGDALAGVFSPEEDAAWAQTFSEVPEHAFNSGASGLVKALTLGEDFEGAALNVARGAGMDPAKAAELVDYAYEAQRAIVDRAIANVGIGEDQREAFYEFCRDNPGQLGNALQHLIHGRDVSHFQRMARSWAAGR